VIQLIWFVIWRALLIFVGIGVLSLAGCEHEARKVYAFGVLSTVVGIVIIWDVVRYLQPESPPPPTPQERFRDWLESRRIDRTPDDDEG